MCMPSIALPDEFEWPHSSKKCQNGYFTFKNQTNEADHNYYNINTGKKEKLVC